MDHPRPNLYEVSDYIALINEAIFEAGGEITPEQEEALNKLEGTFEAKCEAIVRVIKNNEIEYAKIDGWLHGVLAEASLIRARRDAIENTTKRLKEYMVGAIDRAGKAKGFEAGLFKLRLQINGNPSITLVDEHNIPGVFVKDQPVEFSATKALEWLKGLGLVKKEVGKYIAVDALDAPDADPRMIELAQQLVVDRGQHVRIS